MIVPRHQQPVFSVRDNAANSARASRYDRHAGGKRLEYRTRHVVYVRAIQKDMRLVVKLIHFLGGDASTKFNVPQFQITGKPFEFRPLTAVSRDNQPCIGKLLLDFFESPQNTSHVVQRIKISVRQKDRLQRLSLVKLEAVGIDDIRDRVSTQTKLAEHLNQVSRRDDDLIR